MLNISDQGTEIELKRIEFNRRIQYKDVIINLIKDMIKINNNIYKLKAVICTPKYNHFTALIINYGENISKLERGNSYYYDSMSQYHDIIKVKNFRAELKKNLPYLALYGNN